MRSLNNTGITIPGGFRWRCQETGRWVPSLGSMPCYTDFISECKKHHFANNLPIGSQFEQQIQDQLCVGLDGSWCQENGRPIAPSGGWGFTVDGVVQGSHQLAQKMVQAKVRRVPAETSTRRSSICLDCQFNQGPVGCTSCSQAAINNAAATVDGGEIAMDSRLRACKVTGFSLKALINVPDEILSEVVTGEQKRSLPRHCWIA